MVGNPLRAFADDDTINNSPNVVKWCDLLNEAGEKFGKSVNVNHLYKGWMQDAGFQNIKEEIYKVYIGLLPDLMVKTNPYCTRSR